MPLVVLQHPLARGADDEVGVKPAIRKFRQRDLELPHDEAAFLPGFLREEIGLETRVGPLIELIDRITRDEVGRVQYHYVLADFLCHRVSGALRPGSDAGTLALAHPDGLAGYKLTEKARDVIVSAVGLR